MRTRKRVLTVLPAVAFLGVFCLLAVAGETRHGDSNSHLRTVAQQGKTAKPSADSKEDYPIDKWLTHALEQDSTTAGMINATNSAQQKWDQEMNIAYGTLMKRLNPEQRAALLKAQKAWLQYRDADNHAVGSVYIVSGGGSMYRVMAAATAMERTKQRALELQEFGEVADDNK